MISVKFLIICLAAAALALDPESSVLETSLQSRRSLQNNAEIGLRPALEPCKSNAHVEGTWWPVETLSKSFICCQTNADDFRWNTSLCGNTSYGEHGEAYGLGFAGSESFNIMSGGRACECDKRDSTRLSVNQIEKYQWVPTRCSLLKWDANLFCKLLGDRVISLVGDSTMLQTAATLINMIRAGSGGCQSKIRYSRTDFLAWGNSNPANVQLDLLGYINTFKPDIAIINYGAHASDAGDVWTIWDSLNTKLIPQIKKLYPNLKLVWRSSHPGHGECQNENKPKAFYSVEEQSHLNKYHWHETRRFDSISHNNSLNNGMAYMDMSPLYFRPDAHPYPDCLHYCLPGPLNLFSVLLLQMLSNNEI